MPIALRMAPFCEVTIVYDSDGLPGFETGWGFSALVETGGSRLLFDCGWDPRILRWNLGRIGVSPSEIDKVVLSHDHWDHISGLTGLLSEPVRDRALEVIVPASFSANLKDEIRKRADLIEVESILEISPGIFSTGQLGGKVKEQALVISRDGKSIVLTGCAHPGIDAIIERAGEIAGTSWLIGGFHGAKAEQIPDTLEKIVISHCTKERDAIMDAFGARATIGRAGDMFVPEW